MTNQYTNTRRNSRGATLRRFSYTSRTGAATRWRYAKGRMGSTPAQLIARRENIRKAQEARRFKQFFW
ncbi:MAG: hypothetical protein Q7R56_01805 [Nanoarchaeota archaeon]|nr:hypothetical protein [Nanoarchaeota archaeon]